MPIPCAVDDTASLPPALRTSADPARHSVLVADDDAGVRDLLAAYFSRRGYAVAWARDGRAALAALEARPGQYGVVVTDLQMAGADGLAVLKAAKHANPSCVVVIVTGYASLDTAVEAVRLGAFDYLAKPFTLGQMDLILDRLAERDALEERSRLLAAQLNGRGASTRDLLSLLLSASAQLDRLEGRVEEVAVLVRALAAERRG